MCVLEKYFDDVWCYEYKNAQALTIEPEHLKPLLDL